VAADVSIEPECPALLIEPNPEIRSVPRTHSKPRAAKKAR
jgi:hypothetical protein